MATYFKFEKKDLIFTTYQNNRPAIITEDEDLSVNVDCELQENEIAIKDYSENDGVLNDLVKMGIVSEPVRFVQSGFVNIPICKLL